VRRSASALIAALTAISPLIHSAAATAIVALITAAGGDAADVGALVIRALVMDAAALQADVTDVVVHAAGGRGLAQRGGNRLMSLESRRPRSQ
jgi:hypothetical protein